MLAIVSLALLADFPIVDVFTQDELYECGGEIRIPQMTVTPSGVLLIGQCRKTNSSAAHVGLGDDQTHCRVLSKFSSDNGLTWSPMKILTPEVGHSHGVAVYDSVRKQTLLQWQYHPNVDPSLNSTMYQAWSSDDGATWSPARDITSQLAGCNPAAPDLMMVGSAGSHVQSSSGRLLFFGHADRTACRWWSDDGGLTYQTSDVYTGNEAAVAEFAPSQVYMTARGNVYPWAGNRTSSWSADDGATFTPPASAPITEAANNSFGCSVGLVADPLPTAGGAPARLFQSLPAGPGRSNLIVRCSLDGGRTWPRLTHINPGATGKDAKAAYSALRLVEPQGDGVGERLLLVVWEVAAAAGFSAQLVNTTNWCV